MGFEELESQLKKLPIGRIVSCPEQPESIPGIVAADALDANDAFGTLMRIKVPKSGIIYSALLLDIDDEGSQVDLEIFKSRPVQVASDAAWDLPASYVTSFVCELNFIAFDDHTSCQTSQLSNIGIAYTAPEGYLWIQAVARGTPNIAAGASPKIQLNIIPDDPDWR